LKAWIEKQIQIGEVIKDNKDGTMLIKIKFREFETVKHLEDWK